MLTGVVLGSFYYGYVALQIPGGWLALKLGGTRLFGSAVLMASVLTLLTPLASRASVVLLIVVRVCEGLVLVSISFNYRIHIRNNARWKSNNPRCNSDFINKQVGYVLVLFEWSC